jgi:thioredoxin reductase (NADPH)
MPDPVMLLIDDSRGHDRVEEELRKRYGADYEVLGAASVGEALGVLDRLHAEGRQLSLVLADQALPEVGGTELLSRIRRRHPTAKRVLLVAWADQTSQQAMILEATALGHIDAYVAKPVTVPDERFHRIITELLDQWARSHLPGFEAVRVIGEEWSARSHEICERLGRNGIPFGFYPAGGAEAGGVLEQAGIDSPRLPVLVLFDGRVLADPSNAEVAEALGVSTRPVGGTYDVTVIGAGPAGLAAAVYGASEGLSTVVLEPEAIGGQAGTSSMIRNYLGFPNGVSGEELAVRAYTQAWNFGAELVYGNPAAGLRGEGGELVVTLADGDQVRSRAVVVATGMSYRRLGIPELDELIGAGVFYGAATTEAPALRGREVHVVGGANSAGQAAIHLARYASRVTLLVRGPSLAAGMSDYLVRQILSTPNIEVRNRVVVTGGGGDGRLERLELEDLDSGATRTLGTAALFVLIGAEPRTQWLPEAVRRDRWGFVLTGGDLLEGGRPPAGWPPERLPMFLESSLPGVFAAGDVRHGSVKRVASAVGEGSIAIRLVHDHLGDG